MQRNRVVAITGAARGIGNAIATRLDADGWTVACLDYSPSEWRWHYPVDVSNFESVNSAIQAVSRDLGPIDAVIGVAGHWEVTPVAEVSSEQWARMLHVHLGGVANLAWAALPEMLTRRHGSVIAIASELAIRGAEMESHYAAAKGAILGLVRSLAVELNQSGVRVNGIAPGLTDTPMLKSDDPLRSAENLSRIPLRRIVKPHEIAIIAQHLLDNNTSISGEVISPNAGATI